MIQFVVCKKSLKVGQRHERERERDRDGNIKYGESLPLDDAVKKILDHRTKKHNLALGFGHPPTPTIGTDNNETNRNSRAGANALAPEALARRRRTALAKFILVVFGCSCWNGLFFRRLNCETYVVWGGRCWIEREEDRILFRLSSFRAVVSCGVESSSK